MKRTLAFIISVMMVLSLIPASLLTALANGTGTAGNYVENLSIDNASFKETEIPASIVADGKLDDTGWQRDQWNKVSSATGTWDVATPSHSNLVYEYQIQRDHQFLYGAYSFDMQTVESGNPKTVTLWLNDGTDGEAFWTQRIDITITVSGDNYTAGMKRYYSEVIKNDDGSLKEIKSHLVDENDVYLYSENSDGTKTYKYFVNDKDYYVLSEAPACVVVRDTQKSVYDENDIISDKVIVEFRTLLDVFSDQKQYDAYINASAENKANANMVFVTDNNLSERDTITHITSASFGDGGALYYPLLNVGEDNREMVDPSVSWPANSMEIAGSDIMNNDGTADYNNVLPSGIDVDGVFSEGVWSHISNFCRYGWANGGMSDDYRAEGNYVGADLKTFKNQSYHNSNWGLTTLNGSAKTLAQSTNTDAVRFKYDIGLDQKYVYGAMVIYSDEDAVENCGDSTSNRYFTVNVSDYLNVRSSADSTNDDNISGQVYPGEIVEFLQWNTKEQADATWAQIRTKTGLVGWVARGPSSNRYLVDNVSKNFENKLNISLTFNNNETYAIKLYNSDNNAEGESFLQNDIQILDGADEFRWSVGGTVKTGYTHYRSHIWVGNSANANEVVDENGLKSGMVAKRISKYLVQVEFRFTLEEAYGFKTIPENIANYGYTIKVEDGFGNIAYGGSVANSGQRWGYSRVNDSAVYADGFTISDGALDQRTWPNMYAADDHVDYMVNALASQFQANNGDKLGTANAYLYKLISDYDYLYGAAVVWDEDAWYDETNKTSTGAFDLWINSGTCSATGDKSDINIRFYYDGTTAHSHLKGSYVVNNGSSGEMVLEMTDPAGVEVAIKDKGTKSNGNAQGGNTTVYEYLVEFKVPLSYLNKSIESGAPSYSDTNVAVFQDNSYEGKTVYFYDKTQSSDNTEYTLLGSAIVKNGVAICNGAQKGQVLVCASKNHEDTIELTVYKEAPTFNAIVSVSEWYNSNISRYDANALFHSEIISGNNYRLYNKDGYLSYYSSFPIANIDNVKAVSKSITNDTNGIGFLNKLGVVDTAFDDLSCLTGWPEDSDMTFTYDQRQGTGERLDYFNLDGKLEEFFWNNEAERVKVNGGNGYWAQVPATSEDFDYEYRIYTGTENLYGAFKVNAVEKGTKMAIWFNVDGRDGASHKLEFWMEEDSSEEYVKNDDNYKVAWTLTGPDGIEIETHGNRLSDGGDEQYVRAVMKTINDETVLEFVMDLDIIDTAKDTVTNYNDYWKNFAYPTFASKGSVTSRSVYIYNDSTKIDADYASGITTNSIANGKLVDAYTKSGGGNLYYKVKASSTTSNGNVWGYVTTMKGTKTINGTDVSYGIVKYYYQEVTLKNADDESYTATYYYSDSAMSKRVYSMTDAVINGYVVVGDAATATKLPQYPNSVKDGFEYVVGVSQPVGKETLTLYHNGNGNKTFWVSGYNWNETGSLNGVTDHYTDGAGIVLTADDGSVTVGAYASAFIFKYVGDGLYQVTERYIATEVKGDPTHTISAPSDGFAYVVHVCDTSNITYGKTAHDKAVADFTVNAYIQFSNLVIADNPQYSEFAYFDTVPNTVNEGSIIKEKDGYQTLRGDSKGSSIDIYDAGYAPLADYRVVTGITEEAPNGKAVAETYLPAAGGWSSRALEIAPLLDYKIEYITVDGNLEDNGWTEDGWTYVDSDVNSNLQTIVYGTPSGITDKDAEYTYKYQIRTDGEYIYVAAVLDIGMQVATGNASDPAEPFFRIWFNNHPERNKGDDGNDYNRLTFTKRYEVIANKGGTSDNYTVATPNFDARTYLNGWSAADTVNMNKGSNTVNYNYGDITDDELANPQAYLTYNNVKLNVGGFSWTTEAGDIDYANPSGGVEANPEVNGDKDNKTVTNIFEYDKSSFFGETIITEENTTSGWGSNDKDPTSPVSADPAYGSDFDDGWVAERKLTKVTYGDQHATMVETTDGKTQVEFRIKLDEVTDENGEFEYTVFAGLDYGQDLVQFYPMVDKEAGIYFPSGYDRFYNPNWFWPTNHFEWNAEVERDLMLRSPYEPVVNIGSQYFEAYPYTDKNADGSYPSGLRLGGYYIQDYIHRQIRDDYGLSDYEEWDYWDVLEMGILYIPSQKYKVDDGTDATGLKVLSPTTITPGATDAEADNILNWAQVDNNGNVSPDGHLQTCFADYRSFIYYAVIVGIPENRANLKYSYRCYMDYYGNDGLLNYEGSPEFPEYVDYYRETSSSNLVPSYDKDGKTSVDENGNLVMAPVDCKGQLYMETDEKGNIIYKDENDNIVTRKYDDDGNYIYVDENGNPVDVAGPTPLYKDFYAPVLTRSCTMAKSDLDKTYSYTEIEGTNGYISGYTYTNTDEVYADALEAGGTGKVAAETVYEMGDIGTFQKYFKERIPGGSNNANPYVEGALLGYLPYYASYESGTNASRSHIEPANKERVEYIAAAAGYNLQTVVTWADVKNTNGVTNWVICLNAIDETGWAEVQTFAQDKNVVLVYPWEWTIEIPEDLTDNITIVSGNNMSEGVLPAHSVGLLGVAAFTNKYVGNVNLHINNYGDDFDDVEKLAGKIGATVNYNNTEALEVMVLNSTEPSVVDNFLADLTDNLAESVPTVVINAVEGAKGHEFNEPKKATLVDFDELLIEVPNIGRLLGYSSWKDENTSAAIALSNAISRYSFLKYGISKVDEDVAKASHKGFVQSLVTSLVADIAYEIDFMTTSLKKAGSKNDAANLCINAFAKKADQICNYINCSDIVSSIGSTVTTDLFGGGKVMIGELNLHRVNSQLADKYLSDLEADVETDADDEPQFDRNMMFERVGAFEILFTDGINHAHTGAKGEVFVNTSLNLDKDVQYRGDTAVLRDTADAGYKMDYTGSFGNLSGTQESDGKVNLNLTGSLNDGYATPTVINRVLPDVITHENFVSGSMNFDLGVEAGTWFAFVDDRMKYFDSWYRRLVVGGANSEIGYGRVKFQSDTGNVNYCGIDYNVQKLEVLLFPDTDVGNGGIVDVSWGTTVSVYLPEHYGSLYRGYENGAADDMYSCSQWNVVSNDSVPGNKTNVNANSYMIMQDRKLQLKTKPEAELTYDYYALSHAALYTAFWGRVDKEGDGNGSINATEAYDFLGFYPDGMTNFSTSVHLDYINLGGHYYYVKEHLTDGTYKWKKVEFTFDASYAQSHTLDTKTIGNLSRFLSKWGDSENEQHEGFSNSVSYSNSYWENGWGQVQSADENKTVVSYTYSQFGYGEIIVDVGSSMNLSALRLHMAAAADAMCWSPTMEVYTSDYSGDLVKGGTVPNDTTMGWTNHGYVAAAFTEMDEHVYWTGKGLGDVQARYVKIKFTLNNGDVYYIDEVEVYGSANKVTQDDTHDITVATYNVGQMADVFYETAEYNYGQGYYADKPASYFKGVGASKSNGANTTLVGAVHGDDQTAGYTINTSTGAVTGNAATKMGQQIAAYNAARKTDNMQEVSVIMLQEVQQYVQRFGAMDQLKLMAEAAGYPYFYYASANEYDASGNYAGEANHYFNTKGVYDDPTTRMDNPSGGVAIMSKYPIVAARTYYQDSGEQSIAYAQIYFNGKYVDVYSAHFAANGGDRAATHDNRMDQYALLNHVLKGRNEYSIVGGDFNERYLNTYSDNVDGMNNILNTDSAEYYTCSNKVIDNILVEGSSTHITDTYGTIQYVGVDVLNHVNEAARDKHLNTNADNTSESKEYGYSDHFMAVAKLSVGAQ